MLPTLLLFALSVSSHAVDKAPAVRPASIVDVKSLEPSLHVEMMYLGSKNFVGQPVEGYKANICYLAKPAAEGLRKAQKRLVKQAGKRKLTLLMQDCYRPVKAVQHFLRWAQDPKDLATKTAFYPEMNKDRIVPDGYVASESGHSKAATVDLTIAEILKDGKLKQLDMGTPVDFFGVQSNTLYPEITEEQKANRELLLQVMEPEFANYPKEWWHFALKKQPFTTPFDFDVE